MSTVIAVRRARVTALALLLPTLLELAACGGAPRPRPAALEREAELARRGGTAFARGDVAGALAFHERALAAARSVEDEEGIAVRILDIAALHRHAGATDAARAALAELLAEPPPLAYPPGRRAEAMTLVSLIALDEGGLPEARSRAVAAQQLCHAARCPTAGTILNLLARIDLLEGNLAGARRRAGEALRVLRPAGDSEELANAHRIVADALLAEGHADRALESYAAALAIDKRLGASDKLGADLAGLGRAALALGRPQEALAHYRRARAVALAAGDEAGAAALDAEIRRLAPDVR